MGRHEMVEFLSGLGGDYKLLYLEYQIDSQMRCTYERPSTVSGVRHKTARASR